MGWPPCMAEGCDNWPSIGFTGVCQTCITDPDKVAHVARQMHENRARFDERKNADHTLVCWLSREPQKCVEMVLEVLRVGQADLRTALVMARTLYWETRQKARQQ